MFRRSRAKKDSGAIWAAYIGLGLFYVLLAGILVFFTYGLSSVMVKFGMVNEMLTMLLTIGCLAVLIFGLISMLSVIYFSKDTEFFMTLPVKPSVVYLAKLSIVYVSELLLSTLLLLPCLLTAGISIQLGPVYYITMLFGLLFVPALPLLLASLLAIPLMYIVSFFRNKGVLTSLVLILLFGAFFVGYMLLINSVTAGLDNVDFSGDYFEQFGETLKGSFVVFTNVLFPLAALARFSTMTATWGMSVSVSMLANLAIFLASIAALITLTVLISNAVYRRGAASMLEGGKKKVKENIGYSFSGTLKTLMKKEWRELIRTPAFAFQSLSGIILCPIMLIIVGMSMRMGGEMSGATEVQAQAAGSLIHFMLLGFICMMGVGMNVGASTCISREGDKFVFCKMIPVSPAQQLRAKTYVYLIVSGLTVVLGLIVICILQFNFLNLLLSLGFLVLYDYGYVHFAVFFDLYRPKLNWATPNEAVKNNRSATIPLFINMGISFAFIALPGLLSVMITPSWVGQTISWLLLYGVAIAAAVVFHYLLYKNADRLYNQIKV